MAFSVVILCGGYVGSAQRCCLSCPWKWKAGPVGRISIEDERERMLSARASVWQHVFVCLPIVFKVLRKVQRCVSCTTFLLRLRSVGIHATAVCMKTNPVKHEHDIDLYK